MICARSMRKILPTRFSMYDKKFSQVILMKKIFCLMIILFVLCNNVSAQTKLRVGYVPSMGFLAEDRAGHISGYGYEYMEFLARYGNWKFEYVPSSTWQECNEKLQSGRIDLLPAMPGDYRALQNVKRTEHVVGRYPMQLITHDGKIKSHMRLGTIPANPPIPSFETIAKNEGFTYELVHFPLFYDMEEAFKRRELDGYIAPMIEPNKAANVATIFDRQSYRILIRPDRKDLLDAVNSAQDMMLMDQPNIRDRLNQKYLRTGGFPLILDKQEKEYLTQKKRFTTAIFMQNRPYAYNENGELHGIIPSLLEVIAKDLDIEIEIIDTDDTKDATNLIRTGKIDFVADAICDFSWAESLNMAPTQSYLNLEYVSVTRRDFVLNDSAVVACVPDLLYTKNFIFKLYPEDRRYYCTDLKSCFEAVSDGRADVLFAPRSETPYLVEESDSYNLDIAPESTFSDSLSLGVSLSADPKLWRILNKEVNHLDMDKIRNSINKDMVMSVAHVSLQWQLYHNPLRVIGIMFLIAGIIGGAVWYRMYLRKKDLKEVQHMAYTDRRYQLPNLSLLEETLPKVFAKYKDNDDENLFIVTLIIDSHIDRDLRDSQIKNMAEQLKNMPENILTAVNSENDGLVNLCKSKNISDVARVAREVIRRIGFMETKDSRLWIYIKVGICAIDENNLNTCIESAQIACRKSNKDVAIFDSQLQESLSFEKEIESRMKDALSNGEFQALYQTEYDIKNHEVVGAEAFIRWQSSDLGFLLPEKFLPLFERNGFITAIDFFVVEEVFKLQKQILESGKKILPIAINQSGLHLTEENYLEKMKLLVKRYNLPAGSIKLEFSERIFNNLTKPEHETRIVNILQSLQKLGFKISADNFGAGYSSYKLVNHFAMDELKIDRSILYAANNSKRMRDVLETIIQLGNKLSMTVICEGIETKEQEKLLLQLGCKFGQGFMNSDLLSAEDFIDKS